MACAKIARKPFSKCLLNLTKEPLINYLYGMKRKAHGAQKPRYIKRIVEVASTAQRSDSPAQAINQRFHNSGLGKL